MVAAGFVRNPRLHKPFLGLGVGLMGVGFLAAAASTNLVAVSFACGLAAAASVSSRRWGSRCSPR